jgi:hypothetical protein
MSRQSRASDEARHPRRKTGPRLTDRDREVLVWICRHGVVVIDQVADKFFGRGPHEAGKWAADKRMKALENLGLIVRDKPYHRAADVIRVTRAGARLAGCGVGQAKLVLPDVPHDLAVVDLTEDILKTPPTPSAVDCLVDEVAAEVRLDPSRSIRRVQGPPPNTACKGRGRGLNCPAVMRMSGIL